MSKKWAAFMSGALGVAIGAGLMCIWLLPLTIKPADKDWVEIAIAVGTLSGVGVALFLHTWKRYEDAFERRSYAALLCLRLDRRIQKANDCVFELCSEANKSTLKSCRNESDWSIKKLYNPLENALRAISIEEISTLVPLTAKDCYKFSQALALLDGLKYDLDEVSDKEKLSKLKGTDFREELQSATERWDRIANQAGVLMRDAMFGLRRRVAAFEQRSGEARIIPRSKDFFDSMLNQH